MPKADVLELPPVFSVLGWPTHDCGPQITTARLRVVARRTGESDPSGYEPRLASGGLISFRGGQHGGWVLFMIYRRYRTIAARYKMLLKGRSPATRATTELSGKQLQGNRMGIGKDRPPWHRSATKL